MNLSDILSGTKLSIHTDAGWTDLGEVIEVPMNPNPIRTAKGRVVSDSCELAALPLQDECSQNSAEAFFSQKCVHSLGSDAFFSDQTVSGLSPRNP